MGGGGVEGRLLLGGGAAVGGGARTDERDALLLPLEAGGVYGAVTLAPFGVHVVVVVDSPFGGH